MIVKSLTEDTIRSLAAQFDTLPEAVRAATGMYLPCEKPQAYYEGYASALVTIVQMLEVSQAAISNEVLIALAGKAAQIRQSLVADEEDCAWLDYIDAWLDAN